MGVETGIVMSQKAYEALMVDGGWTRHVDDGEAYFSIDLGDRVLRCFPTFSKLPDAFVLRDGGQVWFEEFARSGAFILGGDPDFWALTRRKNSAFRTDGDATPEFIAEMTGALKQWALSILPGDEITAHAAIKPRYGLNSSNHIAALALRGDVDRLKSFADEIHANGKAEALHSMIKADVIDRALALGQAVAAGTPPSDFLTARIDA